MMETKTTPHPTLSPPGGERAIPVLGIPHYNRPDLLQRCIESIDYPVEKLVMILNGPERRFGFSDEIHGSLEAVVDDPSYVVAPGALPKKLRKFQHVELIIHPNAGVAASWNEIIKLFPAPWWMLANNDIEFAPGDLQRMAEFVEKQIHSWECPMSPHPALSPPGGERMAMPSKFVMVKPAVIYGNHGASWMVVTKYGVEKVGLFDENFYPAYLEDCDWSYRADMLGARRVNAPLAFTTKHGDANMTGSCTILSDPVVRANNHRTHGGNFDYYRAKWGGINGEEKFRTPFNEPHFPLWAWKFDPTMRQRQQW